MVNKLAILLLLIVLPARTLAAEIPVVEGGTSADTGGSSLLQPANPETLQPTGSEIQVPDEQRLQTAATKEQIANILSGKTAGGGGKGIVEPEEYDLPIIPFVFGLFILGFVVSYLYDRYKTKRAHQPITMLAPLADQKPAAKPKKTTKAKLKDKGTRKAKAAARAKKAK